MNFIDWLNSPWPYLYFIGITTALSINWMWNRHTADRDASRERHPARQMPEGLATYDPHAGEFWEGGR